MKFKSQKIHPVEQWQRFTGQLKDQLAHSAELEKVIRNKSRGAGV